MDGGKSKRLIKKFDKREALETENIEEQVKQVLVELLEASESDSVRVAAAKALMDQIDKRKRDDEKGNREDEEDKAKREATISEAFAFLTEITDVKSGRTSITDQVD